MTDIDYRYSKFLKRAQVIATESGSAVVTDLHLLLSLVKDGAIRAALKSHGLSVKELSGALKRAIAEDGIDPGTMITDDLMHNARIRAISEQAVARARAAGRAAISAVDLIQGFSALEDGQALRCLERMGIDFQILATTALEIAEAKRVPPRSDDTAAEPSDEDLRIIPGEVEAPAKARRKRKPFFEVRKLSPDDDLEGDDLSFETPPSDPPPRDANHLLVDAHPEQIDRSAAVRIAYSKEINSIAAMIRANLSVIVKCDKSMTQTIWETVLDLTGNDPVLADGSYALAPGGTLDCGASELRDIVARGVRPGTVVILPNLDVMAVGAYSGHLSDPAREVTILLSKLENNAVLGFTEPSVELPELLTRRFSTQQLIQGVPPTVTCTDGKVIPFGDAITTRSEIDRMESFDPYRFHKNVAGLNVIQVRNAIDYLMNVNSGDKKITMRDVEDATQQFKSSSIATFQIPDTKFEDVGGYDDVKKILKRAIRIIENFDGRFSDKNLADLLPKGFILHGPTGTGKTLLAKAIANELKANIVVISGPEVMNMYVGESERNVRQLFASARAAAPSVLVFEEFDAIASKRSDSPGYGSRVNNTIVTQLLTELDGFRPELKILLVGTTNKIDMIDEALLRPSRLQSLQVDLPDDAARRQIIGIHSSRYGFQLEEALIEQIISSTTNFNGDEIQSLFRDAWVAREYDEPMLDDSGQDVSDAFLLGRLVQILRNRMETERHAPGSRVSMGGTATASNNSPRQILTVQIGNEAWESSGMLDLSEPRANGDTPPGD